MNKQPGNPPLAITEKRVFLKLWTFAENVGMFQDGLALVCNVFHKGDFPSALRRQFAENVISGFALLRLVRFSRFLGIICRWLSAIRPRLHS